MQNINHFLIFSNTFNPKHTPTTPQKKESPQKNPSAPSCSECSKNPHPQNPPPQKAKKKIATRQAGSNHYIKQLLSLKQKI